jgi:hypothetical protein
MKVTYTDFTDGLKKKSILNIVEEEQENAYLVGYSKQESFSILVYNTNEGVICD